MFQKTKTLFFAFGLLLFSSLPAQVIINGEITFGPDGGGFPGWLIQLLDENGSQLGETVADDLGFFIFDLDTTVDGPTSWTVSTLDVCTGANVEEVVDITPDVSEYMVSIALCSDIDPPPTTDSCHAFIGLEGNPASSLEYSFFSLSNAIDPITDYFWDFGDGTSSTEENPVHLYENGGAYVVTLSITAGECTSTDTQYINVFNPSDCECPEILDPVCVFDYTGQLLTFDNACLAICAGYSEDHFYDCSNDCFCPTFEAPVCVLTTEGDTLVFDNHCLAECDGYGPDSWVDCGPPPPACDCEDEPYDPVCIDIPGVYFSFNNICEALCLGLDSTEIDLLVPCEPDTSCNCFEIYDPVCVQDSVFGLIHFPNSCFAECEGYTELDFVSCDDNPVDTCGCDEIWMPVCVQDENGDIVSYDNECIAVCAGYTSEQFVICDPCPYDYIFGHPLEVDVCAFDDAGDIISFESVCEAFFLGYGFEDLFPCEQVPDTCNCIEVYEPVCVNDSTGVQLTFSNSCFAECAGYSLEDLVECDGPVDPCLCNDIFLPVCVLGEGGVQIPFGNECEAICAGYSEEDIVVCDPCPFDDIFGVLEVCAVNDEGDIVTFASICEALGAGYGVEEIFPCGDDQVFCQADFSAEPVSEDGLTLQFTDFSFAASGEVSSWDWSFGDGNSSSEANPEHTYLEPGLYEVALTINSELDSCSSTTMYAVVAGEEDGNGPTGLQCQSFFFFEQPDPEDLLTFQFIDFSLGDNETWFWDFGDGSTSLDQNPTHTFTEENAYTVSLTIVTTDGCEATTSIVVNAGEDIWYGDLTCRAWFLPIIVADTPGVYFLNLSSYDAISFAWDYGDGTGSSEFQDYHVFPGDGTYTINLTIETESGCTNTFTVTITIGGEDEGFVSDPSFRLISSAGNPSIADQLSVQVSPNPTHDQVRIKWLASRSGTYSYQLYDLNGRQLQQDKRQVTAGENQLDLRLGDQPAGLYLLRLQTPDGVETVRLSKQN